MRILLFYFYLTTGILFLSYGIYLRIQCAKAKRILDSSVFFNKLKWKLQTGEMKGLTHFCVDVFCFRFNPELSEEISMKFVEFADLLDMRQIRSIMILFVWLYQHNIKFRIYFKWNRNLPFQYNIKHMFSPRKMKKQLYKYGHDDLMACPLEELVKMYGKGKQNQC